MAQRRLIDRKIITSERVNDLGLLGALLYTWSIVVADDFGVLQGSPRTIKAQIMPMQDVLVKEVEDVIKKLLALKLWVEFKYEEKNYYKIVGFDLNQKFRRDMQPYTILPIEMDKGQNKETYAKNWEFCTQIVKDSIKTCYNTVTTSSDIVTTSSVKISKDKISKDNNNIILDSEKNLDKKTVLADKQQESSKEKIEKKPTCPLLNGSPFRAKYPNGHKECGEYYQSVETRRDHKFINQPKQFNFLHKILRAGYDFDSMNKAVPRIEKEYGLGNWDFATLANWLEKGAINGNSRR
jgi:hypothetical protein